MEANALSDKWIAKQFQDDSRGDRRPEKRLYKTACCLLKRRAVGILESVLQRSRTAAFLDQRRQKHLALFDRLTLQDVGEEAGGLGGDLILADVQHREVRRHEPHEAGVETGHDADVVGNAQAGILNRPFRAECAELVFGEDGGGDVWAVQSLEHRIVDALFEVGIVAVLGGGL